MPTDPPPANQSNPPGPLGQAQPPAQQLPQHQLPYQFAQQQQQTHLPLHPSQQYAISAQSPLHSLPQPSPQRQSSQPHQPQQQQRPPMNQQQSFFPVNSYQQHINSYPGQQFQMGGYIYQSPAYPYPIPPTNPPQQQTPVNSRSQRQFPQPVPSTTSQRASARKIPVQPPKKNILQIVDPDTNEEVKVSKVETRPQPKPVKPPPPSHPPVKIPPKISHALELVSDPADEPKDSTDVSKSTATSVAKSSVETNKDRVVNGDEASVKEKTAVETNITPLEQSVSQDESKTSPVTSETEETVKAKSTEAKLPTEQAQPTEPHVVEAATTAKMSPTSDTVSSSAQTEDREPQVTAAMEDAQPQTTKADNSLSQSARGDSVDDEAAKVASRTTPIEDELKMRAPKQTLGGAPVLGDSVIQSPSADMAPSTDRRDDTVQPAEAPLSSSQLTSEEVSSSTRSSVEPEETVPSNATRVEKQATSAPSTETKQDPATQKTTSDTAPIRPEIPSTQKKSAETGDSQSKDEKADSALVKEDAPVAIDPPALGEGQRRVYVPSFMWDMKSIPNPKKASEYEAALGTRDILKNVSAPNVRRNDSRGNRPVRGSSGPLSTDPRRAFPGQAGAGFQMVPMRGAAPPGIGAVGLGSYDQFDLRSARSQAPPPAPKPQSSVRDGDPRGTRQQPSRGRFDGPTRQGQTPGDPFLMHPQVEKLKRTDKGWKRNRDADDEVTAKVKTVRSLLNKLTLEKFERIFKQIVDVGVTTFEVLDGVVTEIFEKTLFEPKFSGMYAELCRRLEGSLRDVLAKASILDADGKPITFRKILLNHCRDEFTRFAQSVEAYEQSDDQGAGKATDQAAKKGSTEDDSLTEAERLAKAKLKKSEEELNASRAKRRMLANVRFIGELFLKDLLREQIIHKQCIQKLLSLGIEKKEEDTLEALCKLISKTGEKLSENREAINYIDNYFGHLHALSMDHTLPARIRFMLQDLIEQRANNWKVRREEAGAKTIAEIHKEIEKEERAKQEAQAAARERRNRGGGMHGRDRSQQNYPPRMAMTMASSRRAATNVSRTNSVIEKLGSRGTAPMPNNNLQSVRLGPGGARSIGARPIGAGGSGSGPLRPGSGSGMFGSFAALTDNRESGMNGQSGDVRRGKVTKLPASNRRASSRPQAPQAVAVDKLKQKSKSVVQEFWTVGLLDEVRQTLVEEIHGPNYSTFMEEAIRVSINAKVDESEKSVGLLRDLAVEPLSGTDLVNGFSVFLSHLADLEMDNPRVTEFLGKYIGAVASTRNLPEGAGVSFGLDFVPRAISETEDPKRFSKVLVSIFATLQKELVTTLPNEHDRTDIVKRAYTSLGIDVAGLMNAWNPMRGLTSLEDMLKSNGVSFLAPFVKIEQNLKALLQDSPAGDKVLEVLKTSTVLEESLLRAVVRQSLDWILITPPANVKESFSAVIGTPLMKAFGSGFAQDVQMGALLEAQFFITRNLEILPPIQVGSFDKAGAIAFDLLYDAEIVSRNTFVQWKEDTGKSLRVPGKEKVLNQTSQFFQWLGQLQQ